MSGKKKYSREMLEKAVQEVKAGASLRATSKKYGIPTPRSRTTKKINTPTTLRRRGGTYVFLLLDGRPWLPSNQVPGKDTGYWHHQGKWQN